MTAPLEVRDVLAKVSELRDFIRVVTYDAGRPKRLRAYAEEIEMKLDAILREHQPPPAEADPRVRCDGNHGGPRCADPECWHDETNAPEPTPRVQTCETQGAHIYGHKGVCLFCGEAKPTDNEVALPEQGTRDDFARVTKYWRDRALKAEQSTPASPERETPTLAPLLTNAERAYAALESAVASVDAAEPETENGYVLAALHRLRRVAANVIESGVWDVVTMETNMRLAQEGHRESERQRGLMEENQREAFTRLSTALTSGNAGTWDEVFHAAESVVAELDAQRLIAARDRQTDTKETP